MIVRTLVNESNESISFQLVAPRSVYYCYDKAGALQRGIAEVTNTPWGERVTFLFDPQGAHLARTFFFMLSM